MEEKNNKLPEEKFSAGAVSATVWKNEGPANNGGSTSYYSVSIDRSYKDKNDAWKTTNSLRVNDLPKAVLVISKAYEHIMLKSGKEQRG